MTREEALNLISDNRHLINTTPENSRIETIYYTPSNGEKHDEVVKAILMGYSYEPLLVGYNDFTVHVLYADDNNIGLAGFENLETLLNKLEN
ncbi:hypothetical protein [Sphingobacterium mizutaii]|uniref:hypothetical protein n=1 Tax=Sphingobacterium mizutaii TaxID=1010 RepID=UPI0016235F36|nr:hypothetical protein [Sphingobacterium mizutaii]